MHATWHMQNYDDSGLNLDAAGPNTDESMMHVRNNYNCAAK